MALIAVMAVSGAAAAVASSTLSGLRAIDTFSGTTMSSVQVPACTVGVHGPDEPEYLVSDGEASDVGADLLDDPGVVATERDRELVLDHVLEPAGSTTCPGPTIAEHLDVSISTIGLVVTAYALGIAVGSDGPIGRADQTATRPPSMCSAVAWM